MIFGLKIKIKLKFPSRLLLPIGYWVSNKELARRMSFAVPNLNAHYQATIRVIVRSAGIKSNRR